MVVLCLSSHCICEELEPCRLKFYRGAGGFSNPGDRVESSALKSYVGYNA
jgi:hypothetical protein